MPLYLALQAGTNHRLRQGLAQAEIEPLGKSETLHVLSNRHAHPDEAVETYDPAVLDFVPIAVSAPTMTPKMTRGDWMARIGFQNEAALHAARINPAGDVMQRAMLETLMAELNRRADVDVTHPSTIYASGVVADTLVQLGRIASQDRGAFVAQLLAEAPIL